MLTFTQLLKKQVNLLQLKELQEKKQVEEITFKCYFIYLQQLEYLKEKELKEVQK